VNVSLEFVVKSRAVYSTAGSRSIVRKTDSLAGIVCMPPRKVTGRLALIAAPDPPVDVLDPLAGLEHDEGQLVGFRATVLELYRLLRRN
jgi:hypothetical protein